MTMSTQEPRAGWYLDPYEPSGEQMRYWDGQIWTGEVRPILVKEAGFIVEGPNHVLHAILTFVTLPLAFISFGLVWWLWVWLIVAAVNKKRVRKVYQ